MKKTKIEDEDWRLQGVYTACKVKNPWPGIKTKPGNKLKICGSFRYNGKDVTLGIPSAVALFLDIAFSAFRQATDLREKAFDSRNMGYVPDDLAFVYFEKVMTSIVFAHTALESFANGMIPDDYVYYKKGRIIFEPLKKHCIERKIKRLSVF